MGVIRLTDWRGKGLTANGGRVGEVGFTGGGEGGRL
jgi:hypothetical protein